MTNNKRHGKSIAREHAIESLYTYSILGDNYLSDDKLGNDIVNNVLTNKEELDSRIKKYLRKWVISELNPVDLAILEIAVYEIIYTDTPKAVIVNEALELTKKFSDDKSKKFVHRVLDNIIKE